MGSTLSTNAQPVNSPLSSKEIQPADVIDYMHRQLIFSEDRRKKAGMLPLFEVDSLEIELKVNLHETIGADGKVNFKLIAIATDTKLEQERVHTIRLKLRSVPPDNET